MEYNEYHDEIYFEDDYPLQTVGCLPILFVVIGVAFILVLVLSRVNITIPAENAAANLSGSSNSESQIASFFTPEVQYWVENIIRWSEQTGLDPNLIATVMQIESCGDPQARSGAGAMGLFQVMPYHFENGEDPYKPTINARRGLSYLNLALDAGNGSVRFALAGYNGGITGAQRSESQWANETQRYVYWGMGIYEEAILERATSDRLNEWLEHGGSSLCNQAAQRLGIKK